MTAEILVASIFGCGVGGLAFALSIPAQNQLAARLAAFGPTPTFLPQSKTPTATEIFQGLKLQIRKSQSARLERAVLELTDVLGLMSVSLAGGESIFGSLTRIAERAEGEIAREVRRILRAVELGASLPDELAQLGRALPVAPVVEFASKISLSLTRGTPLSEMLDDQAQSVHAEIRNRLLKRGGKNETRMLIPLVFLILPITVIFAIYPSLKLLNFVYF